LTKITSVINADVCDKQAVSFFATYAIHASHEWNCVYRNTTH